MTPYQKIRKKLKINDTIAAALAVFLGALTYIEVSFLHKLKWVERRIQRRISRGRGCSQGKVLQLSKGRKATVHNNLLYPNSG